MAAPPVVVERFCMEHAGAGFTMSVVSLVVRLAAGNRIVRFVYQQLCIRISRSPTRVLAAGSISFSSRGGFRSPHRCLLLSSNALPDADLASQVCSRFQAHLPDEMLSTLLPPMEARMAHVAAFTGAPSLDASNIHVALPHCDVLLATITIDTPGTEMIAYDWHDHPVRAG